MLGAKCCSGLIGFVVFVLVHYHVESSKSYNKIESSRRYDKYEMTKSYQCGTNSKDSKGRKHDKTTYGTNNHFPSENSNIKENNKKLTDKLQYLPMEQQQPKTHPEENYIALKHSETASKKRREIIKDTRDNSKLNQCELINKDLEEQIAQCKTAERSKEKQDNSLSSILGKSKKNIVESDSSKVTQRKTIDQDLIVTENDSKHGLTQPVELKQKEANRPDSVHQDLLNKDRNKTKTYQPFETRLKKRNSYFELLVHQLSKQLRKCNRRVIAKNQHELSLNSTINELWEQTIELKLSNDYLKQQNDDLEVSKNKLSQTLNQTEQLKRKIEKELESAQKVATEKDRDLKETTNRLEKAKYVNGEQKKLYEEAMVKVTQSEEKAIELQKEIAKMNKQHGHLTVSKEKCETSLSALMAASGTRGNINLTKMEEYSHEKLAIEFREIYDEEYSNADDELKALQNDTKVKKTEKYLLTIVKVAYQLCSTYATEHKQSINESVTSIGVKTFFKDKKQNDSQELVRVSIDHLMTALELDDIANLTLSTAIRLQEPIVEVLSEIMVNRFEIEPEKQPEMMKYIRKCLEVCWMMNMHSDPIFVKFENVTDSTIFDTKTYKEFDNDGKYLDFIVWPPVYAHEDGRLISKGIAEGKEN